MAAVRATADSRVMTSAPALLITRDELLLDDLLRLAAAAGTTLDVAHDTTSALRAWSSASVVLLGADQAGTLAAEQPPRREQVHVVGHGPAGDGLFRSALATGAADVVELPAADAWVVELLTDAADGTAPTRHHDRRGRRVRRGRGDHVRLRPRAHRRGPRGGRPARPRPARPGRRPGGGSRCRTRPGSGVRWDALVGSHGRLGSRALRAALPERDGLAVLTWPVGPPVVLEPFAVREVLSAAQRGHDLVVVDLPRAVDDVTAEVVSRCDEILVVVEPTVAGVASAGKVAAVLRPLSRRLGLVVRGSGTTVPSEHVAAVLELPLVAEVPSQRRLAEHVDLGLGPVHSRRSPLARAARTALGTVRAGRPAA